jgi:hypothetical protein
MMFRFQSPSDSRSETWNRLEEVGSRPTSS